MPLAAPEETEIIEEEEAPKAAPAGNSGWALLNLLMAIATAILSVVLLLLFFKKKDDDGNNIDDNTDDEQKGNKGAARLLSLIPAIAGIVTFILTEDMSAKMQMVDSWTILMVIFLVINIIIAGSLGHKGSSYDGEDDFEV